MSFSISKNKMSFTADNKSICRELTSTTDKIVAKSSTFLLDTVNYLAEDAIYHCTFQFRAFLPNLQFVNFPDSFNVVINDLLTENVTITLKDYEILGFLNISCTTPILSIKLNLKAKTDAHFTIPANSVINYGILPNESIVKSSEVPQPPPLPIEPPTITHGFTVPVHSGIPDDLEGDYRRFAYSFDRSGTAITHKVVGIYEKSVNDGSKITVNVAMLYVSTGWDVWSIFKREYTGAEYASALTIHNNGSGHEDYSSGYDFLSDTDWVQRGSTENFRAYHTYSDGSGFCPQLYQTGDIPLTKIEL